jgi:hypothetical protein
MCALQRPGRAGVAGHGHVVVVTVVVGTDVVGVVVDGTVVDGTVVLGVVVGGGGVPGTPSMCEIPLHVGPGPIWVTVTPLSVKSTA